MPDLGGKARKLMLFFTEKGKKLEFPTNVTNGQIGWDLTQKDKWVDEGMDREQSNDSRVTET